MPLALVDTSAWIHFFRHSSHPCSMAVDRLLESNEAALCGVTELELRRGMRSSESLFLHSILNASPYLEFVRNDFYEAGALLDRLKKSGINSGVPDALIACLCIRLRIPLLSDDKDFRHFPGLQLASF